MLSAEAVIVIENNIVIVRNPVIENLIKDARNENRLKLDAVDADTIFMSQSAHYRHTHEELVYRLYKRDKEGVNRPKKRVNASKNIPFTRRKIQDMREFISISSHVYFKEAVEKGDINYFINKMLPLERKYKNYYRLEKLKKIKISKIKSKILKFFTK